MRFWTRLALRLVGATVALVAMAHAHDADKANSEGVWHANNPAYASILIQENNCWTSAQPTGAHAHRVVVQRPGGRVYVAGQHVTDWTLTHMLNGKELPYGWTVFAYCDKV